VVAALTAAVYGGSIFAGLMVKDLSTYQDPLKHHPGMGWVAPSSSSIPNNALGDSIRRGASIFDETPLYAASYTSAKVSCSNCHAAGGIQPFASPVVGAPAFFPMFNERAGRVISLKDRIQECFVRSENGKPLDYSGKTMQNLVDYIQWLSTPEPNHQAFRGRGLVNLPALIPNRERGRDIYATQCAGCHGANGEGRAPMFPPVWGPDSFNDGAGMNGVPEMAAFVQHNMPQNRMSIMTPQESYDVSAYIHAQPRPALNKAYRNY
jgi:thiosulfate dehydrogenase